MPESRSLSEPTLEQLRRAIANRHASPAIGDAELNSALQVVASEARSNALRPEELIVALKQAIDRSSVARASTQEDRQLREWMVSACIRAYFETE
jgi:hypothetical protein